MTPPSCSFLLNTLPAEIANSYLQRTYGWRPAGRSTGTSTIFVHRTASASSPIFQEITTAFSGCCRLAYDKAGTPVFLISANMLEFSRILGFLENCGDRLLRPELENLLSRNTTPHFRIQNQVWENDRPHIMGILNITPDSFFDGGKYYQQEDYADIARKMIEAGADIIDIGGESSRPGAQPVDEAEEKNRVIKAIRQIRSRFRIPLSIDTVKPAVADAALAAGADMVNDISGLATGREMLKIVRKHDASYCLMHIQGTPENMQAAPHYSDVISDILFFFQSGLDTCKDVGLENDRILLDPGIGFGKTVLNNIDILRLLPAFSVLNCLILLGTSNKSFIGHLLGREIDERVTGTMATQALGWMQGAAVFRVHNIRETRDTLEMARHHTREVIPAES